MPTVPDASRPLVAVEMSGICRHFGPTIALDGIDLVLRYGEIHAVLGANGAGKTTLMRILAGLDRPDEGVVVIAGTPVTEFEPRAARQLGVALVQQHFTLVPTLTASENLVLARPEGRLRPDKNRVRQRLADLVDRYGLDVRDGVPASQLSVGEQQRLELLRALDADARILVLDEPTAVLTDDEADQLLAVCRGLATEGRAVAIITHRLGEVSRGCDRVSVLRDGRGELMDAPVSSTTRSDLATTMIGSESSGTYAERDRSGATVVVDRVGEGIEGGGSLPVRLAVSALTSGRLLNASLGVVAGEILGVAGVDGNGQADLEAVLSGRVAPTDGLVCVDGDELSVGDPQGRAAAGVAYVPSDRYRYALVRAMDLAENLELGRTATIRPGRRERYRRAGPRLDDWQVRCGGPGDRAGSLSGGNAQKLVLARELDGEPGVVVACYPTRGLDPDAAATVATRLIDRAQRGAAVLWIGADLDELFAVSDRIVVLSGGRLSEDFLPPFDRQAIGHAMTFDVAKDLAADGDAA